LSPRSISPSPLSPSTLLARPLSHLLSHSHSTRHYSLSLYSTAQTCGGLPDALNNTACPSTQSCSEQAWMPSAGHWGCCPFPNGVSCGSYTCCPSGTSCVNHNRGYSVYSTCEAADGSSSSSSSSSSSRRLAGKKAALPLPYPRVVGSAPNVTGDEVCKTGPPLPYDPSRKNILIVGDSVSIGYTPVVAQLMR